MVYSKFKTMEVTNFQAIEKATIHFGQLTALVGAGDSGKSSLLRALRALCLNDGHDDDIRHGAKQLEVTLTLEDGTVIDYWKKKGQGGCYTILTTDNIRHDFSKTQGAVPDEVAAPLGIGVLELDATTELTPQLSDQHDLPFILWLAGSKRARAFGKATRLDTVITAQMSCKKERDNANQMVKECISAMETVLLKRNIIPNYKVMDVGLDEIAADIELIDAETARADRALEIHDRIVEVRSRAVVDVEKYTAWLTQADKSLDFATNLERVGRALPSAEREDRLAKEARYISETILWQCLTDYEEACKEAGVCQDCGGLLTHKECVV